MKHAPRPRCRINIDHIDQQTRALMNDAVGHNPALWGKLGLMRWIFLWSMPQVQDQSRPVDLQSGALPLCYGHPNVWITRTLMILLLSTHYINSKLSIRRCGKCNYKSIILPMQKLNTINNIHVLSTLLVIFFYLVLRCQYQDIFYYYASSVHDTNDLKIFFSIRIHLF